MFIFTQIQTEASDEVEEDIKITDDNSPELLAFCQKMCPLVLKELSKANRSRAFDGKFLKL